MAEYRWVCMSKEYLVVETTIERESSDGEFIVFKNQIGESGPGYCAHSYKQLLLYFNVA
jgi:hypothetical protein